MKKKFLKIILFFSFIQFLTINTIYGLNLEEILEDIKNLPVEKIHFDHQENEKLKAIQIFVLPKTQEELENLLIKWKENGVNTLILRVFHNEGDRYHFFIENPVKKGVYFKTKHAPIILDALDYLIPIARSYDFKIFAWMTTRYADFNNGDLEKIISYSPYKNTFSYAKGINILNDKVQQYLFSLFTDLARYPLDGILLQDDLFLRYNEGFDTDTLNQFMKETGIHITPKKLFIANGSENHVKYTEEFWQWRDWKSRKIAEFVRKLKNNINRTNSSIKIAVNLTYEAISHPKGALAWLAHDIEYLKDASDYFSLMAYHRQIMDELKIDKESSFLYLADLVEKCLQKFPKNPQKVIFKIQVKDWKTNEKISDDEIIELHNHTKNIDKLSLAIVPYPPEPSNKVLKLFFKD